MYIEKIKVENFRNYTLQEIELKPGINIFYGDNAQGKTNIMEAIYLCALGKSFRTKKEKEMIQLGENATCVEVNYQKSDREGNIKASIGEGKSFLVNGVKLKKLSELLRKFIHCIISSR